MTPPLRGIRHVALYSPALEASEGFWTGVMGYVVEWRPDADNVYLSSGTDNLALHRRQVDTAGHGPLDHIGLAVPAAADIDAWATHLQGHGVTLAAKAKTHRDGSRSLYFRDPGGILVQILHHTPISK